jgi:formyl-CoA transferase
VKYSKTPTKIHRRAPNLGEHTEEILAEFGFSEEKIAEMKEGEAI